MEYWCCLLAPCISHRRDLWQEWRVNDGFGFKLTCDGGREVASLTSTKKGRIICRLLFKKTCSLEKILYLSTLLVKIVYLCSTMVRISNCSMTFLGSSSGMRVFYFFDPFYTDTPLPRIHPSPGTDASPALSPNDPPAPFFWERPGTPVPIWL